MVGRLPELMIQTFLSTVLQLELDGRWLWQGAVKEELPPQNPL